MEKQQYEIRMLSEEKQLLEKESKRIPNPVVSWPHCMSFHHIKSDLAGRGSQITGGTN